MCNCMSKNPSFTSYLSQNSTWRARGLGLVNIYLLPAAAGDISVSLVLIVTSGHGRKLVPTQPLHPMTSVMTLT